MQLTTRSLLLVSIVMTPTMAAAQNRVAPTAEASAQPVPVDEDEDADDEAQEVTVTGQRPRGSAIGDIAPERVLDARDIRATGATSINELIASVAAQTGSARGRGGERPVILLNGQRISGFRELRDLPPEAIERFEILPEEVALKYGYPADQRVLNIVLRRRFNSTNVEAGTRVATDGGYVSGRGELGRLNIRNNKRTSINARVEGNGALTEAERDVDPRSNRTLVGSGTTARLTGSHNRAIGGGVAATVTGELSRQVGNSVFGGSAATVPTGGTPTLAGDPLGRRTVNDSAGVGVALNGQRGSWRLSGTGNADISRRTSRNEGAATDLLAADRGRSVRKFASADATATGPLLTLPAGVSNITARVGVSAVGLDSRSTRRGVATQTDLGREIAEASVNVDVPLSRRTGALGRLTANGNAAVRRLSDFGTLTTLGAGFNWSPAARVSLLTSWTQEDGPPSIEQLGDPLLETASVPFFDAVRGETVNVTMLTGGNPALRADRRTVYKVGGNWQPIAETDFRLRAEYVHQEIARPQIAFPAVTPSLAAAFPDRFVRDAGGQLVRVDLRPVNAVSSSRDTVRIGFDFTKPLKSKRPTPAQIAALRARSGRPGGGAGAAGAPPGPGEGRPRGGGGFGVGGRGGGPFGGGQGGRLTFSLTDTVTLRDRLDLGGGNTLNYLGGETLSGTGGRSRHQVEAEGGYYNNGLGARVSANWRSATRVTGGVAGDDLRFGSYGTVDLRLFANLGERIELVSKSPFFRGSQVRFEVNNAFNSRPQVRTGSGSVPLAYQPGRLEPIRRTVGVSFRKLFLPRRFGGGARGGVRPSE